MKNADKIFIPVKKVIKKIDKNSRIKTLYVPERSGQTYRDSDWGDFFDGLVEMD